MQIKKELSKISSRCLYDDNGARPEATFASPTSPTRSYRTRISHHKRRLYRKEHLLRMTYGDRVYPVAKLLTITSIPPLWRNEVDVLDLTKQRTPIKVIEQVSVSEKEHEFLGQFRPLDILLAPQNESRSTQEIVPNKLKSECPSIATEFYKPLVTHFEFVPESIEQKTPTVPSQCAKKRRKPFHSPRQPCLFDDHPLFSLRSQFNNNEENQFSDSIAKKNEKTIQHTPSRTSLRQNVESSYNKLKSAVNSLSSLVKSPTPVKSSTYSSKLLIKSTLSCTNKYLPINLECVPTPELRWYINPITSAPIEEHISTLRRTKRQRGCMVSIQMQTYKISASNESIPHYIISYRTKPEYEDLSAKGNFEVKVRRRDLRENSDFLRVAVMEMLMRKRGKLDDQGPGKARLILPPRTLTTRPPETTANGIPVRWISLTL